MVRMTEIKTVRKSKITRRNKKETRKGEEEGGNNKMTEIIKKRSRRNRGSGKAEGRD